MPEVSATRQTGPNPSGLCQCGCGRRTALARQSSATRGDVKGTPVRYLRGHNGKGGAATPQAGRLRAEKLYPLGPCERCDQLGTLRHHRDENPLNNEPENVEILCHRCHAKAHGLRGGVHWNARKQRWVARPRFNGPQVFLGYFKTESEARQAVDEFLAEAVAA